MAGEPKPAPGAIRVSRLLVVTATTNLDRARPCLESWVRTASERFVLVVILNGCAKPETVTIDGVACAWRWSPKYLGSVPAFHFGVDAALSMLLRQGTPPLAPIVACLHDDLEIREFGWDQKVITHFAHHPSCGLLGFGGAVGLGAIDLYVTPYNPMQLARIGFRSDLVDAEQHGVRSLLPERVACLDGFSQIGRQEFYDGKLGPAATIKLLPTPVRPWAYLDQHGFIHHFYDGALGCLAARACWEAWYLPVRARHLGGQTAVGDAGYQAWAKTQDAGGDRGFWEHAHEVGYELFRDVLPLRV